MNGWFAFERCWTRVVLAAAIPATGDQPGIQDLELEGFWTRFELVAPGLLKLGFRVAIWFVVWIPLFCGDWRRFTGLTRARQDRRLRRLHGSRVWLVRQLVETIKVVACFAYFSHPDARRVHGVPSTPATAAEPGHPEVAGRLAS